MYSEAHQLTKSVLGMMDAVAMEHRHEKSRRDVVMRQAVAIRRKNSSGTTCCECVVQWI